jgi:hypothetical protein
MNEGTKIYNNLLNSALLITFTKHEVRLLIHVVLVTSPIIILLLQNDCLNGHIVGSD